MMVTHVGNQNLRVTVQVERGIRGLEPSVVTAFPTVKLGDGGGPQLLPPVPEESQYLTSFLLLLSVCSKSA
jgi:hypothetical protein